MFEIFQKTIVKRLEQLLVIAMLFIVFQVFLASSIQAFVPPHCTDGMDPCLAYGGSCCILDDECASGYSCSYSLGNCQCVKDIPTPTPTKTGGGLSPTPTPRATATPGGPTSAPPTAGPTVPPACYYDNHPCPKPLVYGSCPSGNSNQCSSPPQGGVVCNANYKCEYDGDMHSCCNFCTLVGWGCSGPSDDVAITNIVINPDGKTSGNDMFDARMDYKAVVNSFPENCGHLCIAKRDIYIGSTNNTSWMGLADSCERVGEGPGSCTSSADNDEGANTGGWYYQGGDLCAAVHIRFNDPDCKADGTCRCGKICGPDGDLQCTGWCGGGAEDFFSSPYCGGGPILTPTPTSPPPTNTPTPTPTSSTTAWFQTENGDVHAENKSILNPNQPTNKLFNVSNGGKAVISYNNGSYNFGGGNNQRQEKIYDPVGSPPSSGDWLANTSTPLSTSNTYDGLKQLLDPEHNGLEFKDESYFRNGEVLYYSSSQVNINNVWNFPPREKAIIFVDDKLFIFGKISVPSNSFLAFIVKGDIEIKKHIPQVEGFYLTDGILNSNSSSGLGPQDLNANGIFIVGDISLGRVGTNPLNKPAEKFTYRPDLWLNSENTGLWEKSSEVSWEEVAP